MENQNDGIANRVFVRPTHDELDVVNAEKVTASVSRSEASDMTKDIFDSWVKLVRKSIP